MSSFIIQHSPNTTPSQTQTQPTSHRGQHTSNVHRPVTVYKTPTVGRPMKLYKIGRFTSLSPMKQAQLRLYLRTLLSEISADNVSTPEVITAMMLVINYISEEL